MVDPPRLALFTRYPTPGQAKTRLIPVLGQEGAAAIHRRLTERTLAMLRRSGLPVEVRATGASLDAFRAWLGEVAIIDQGGGDLGARLARATRPAPVILLGADIPDMELRHVQKARQLLNRNPVVIGPAEDGGYYLLGLARPLDALFEGIPWGTERVLPATLERLRELDIKVGMLEPLADLDRPDDLARWPGLTS